MARSYKQSHVTTSTMESEVDALHDAVLHAIYYKAFLLELCIISLDFVFYMMEDNQAAICFSEEEWIKESSKHIHIRYGCSEQGSGSRHTHKECIGGSIRKVIGEDHGKTSS